MMHHCTICQARAEGCHPWELSWGKDSAPSQYLRADPSYPAIDKAITYYEKLARKHGWKPQWEIEEETR